MASHSVRHYLLTYRSTATSPYQQLLELIPHLSWTNRKKLMMIARARRFPKKGTILYRQTEKTLLLLSRSLSNASTAISDLVSSPMVSGFFLSALLSAPYEERDVLSLKKQLMWKEVSVMESVAREPTINWDAIHSLEDPWCPDFRASRAYNYRIRCCLSQWLKAHTGRVLYPSMGTKAVSFVTRKNLEEYMGRDIDKEVDVTSTTIEHYYSRTGIRVEGPCEMKQRWYPTQASPRTYYAQGGTAYHSSKYLRDSLNLLCDTFWPTNRKGRVSPSGITCGLVEDDVYIYDLTSFTSLFHEHWSFMSFLARYARGFEVTIFDSWEGPLLVDLGDLIWQYLEANVSQPSYVTRIPDLSCLELTHSVAGFLGVYGNLASCTFPHGICLGTVTASDSRLWCAGDDAGSCDRSDLNGLGTRLVAERLGALAKDKVFTASEDGAIALKRPVSLLQGVVYQHQNILWPIFSVMDDKDSRFNLPDVAHPWERVVGAIVSFFRSIESCPISPSDIEFAHQFFTEFYHRYNLPVSGWYPPLTGKHPWSCTIPRIAKHVFGKNPLEVLIHSFYGTQYVGALVDDCPYESRGQLCLGDSWRSNPTPHMSYLVKLGYVERILEHCLYEGRDGFKRALVDATRPQLSQYVYTYRVIETIPDTLQQL